MLIKLQFAFTYGLLVGTVCKLVYWWVRVCKQFIGGCIPGSNIYMHVNSFTRCCRCVVYGSFAMAVCYLCPIVATRQLQDVTLQSLCIYMYMYTPQFIIPYFVYNTPFSCPSYQSDQFIDFCLYYYEIDLSIFRSSYHLVTCSSHYNYYGGALIIVELSSLGARTFAWLQKSCILYNKYSL